MNENEFTRWDYVKAFGVVAGLTTVVCGGAYIGAYAGAMLTLKGCELLVDAYDKRKNSK